MYWEGTDQNKNIGQNDKDLKSFRTLIGQLWWTLNQTHPDISFNLGELSSSVNDATVEHILKANKILKMPKPNKISWSSDHEFWYTFVK